MNPRPALNYISQSSSQFHSKNKTLKKTAIKTLIDYALIILNKNAPKNVFAD